MTERHTQGSTNGPRRHHRAWWLVVLLGLLCGLLWWMGADTAPDKVRPGDAAERTGERTGARSGEEERPGQVTSMSAAPVMPDGAAPAPSTRREMPPHSHVLTYIMEVTGSAQSPGQVGGVRRVSQRRVSGQLKPYPSPEGLVGLYFRAYHQDGTLLLDGMLPNPLEIRLFPPQAGAAPTPPIDRPLQHELPAPFSLRLPDVPGLHRVDFYWVPPSAPFAASRDKSEWLIGSVPVP